MLGRQPGPKSDKTLKVVMGNFGQDSIPSLDYGKFTDKARDVHAFKVAKISIICSGVHRAKKETSCAMQHAKLALLRS